jgi:hypothetical protein
MGKSVSIDQSHSVIQALANNVDWRVLDGDKLQGIVVNPKEAGRQFTAFLKNGGKVIVDGPKVISIDRSKPFNPTTFIGAGWTIAEQDERALALAEVDLTEVVFETTLGDKEKSIKGEDKLTRLKEKGCVRLDAGVFKTLWENQILIPEKWKEKTNGNTTYIFFDGTVLQSSSGYRFVLCLYWRDGEWRWSYFWLGNGFDAGSLSAVLASSTVSSETSVS